MTREEFQNLRRGQIIRCFRADGTYFHRTILPCDHHKDGPQRAHYFPIRRKSWTGRIATCFFDNDMLYQNPTIQLVGYTDELMTDEEFIGLYDAGFDVERGIRRELGELDDSRGIFAKLTGRDRERVMECLERAIFIKS